MNKYQEALNNMCGCDSAYYRGDKDVDLLQELVNKAFPRSGVMLAMNDFSPEVASELCCPNCRKPIVNVWSSRKYTPNYCHYCGQRLKWEEYQNEY